MRVTFRNTDLYSINDIIERTRKIILFDYVALHAVGAPWSNQARYSGIR